MADLLRSGNTMLNLACPVCNNPIFRNKNGNTFCPTCNREVIIEDNSYPQDNKIKKSKLKYNEDQITKGQNEVLSLLKDVLLEKIQFITQKLRKETQISLIKTHINILTSCFDILNKLPLEK
ncbi:MAG: Sjogren's syndrome/scleroderma autoantigen 1 family protein [Candidatus Hermodarchaeota archaeon]